MIRLVRAAHRGVTTSNARSSDSQGTPHSASCASWRCIHGDKALAFTPLFANDCGGFPAKWYCNGGGHITFTSIGDILIVVANLIRILLQFGGALAVLFIIYGGILYVLAAGDPGRLTKAKDTISQAVIGLVIAISAYGLVTFVAARF